MGRPRKVLDEDLVMELAKIGCTAQEIADMFQVDRKTIYNNYKHILHEGWSHMKESLRRAQYKAAMNGNVTMLIWLGKQSLGQKDQPVDHSSPVKKIKLEKTE